MKYLIIHAEDFGYNKMFNEKILELIEKGLVSSTTVMVDHVDDEQEDQIKKLSELTRSKNISVGLHLEFSDNDFQPEIERQYEKFSSIFGFSPSHIDLHRSKFLEEAYPVIASFCKDKNIPCRNYNIRDISGVLQTDNEVISGTRKGAEELKKIIENFNDGESYEMLFHPGKYDPYCESGLNKEREFDVKKIEEVFPTLEKNDTKLISYKDLK